jgi:peroxiredoxin family protein
MTVDNDGPQPPQKLSLVVFSGAFDRIHYALATAAAAAAVARPVTLFFTMDAIRALGRTAEDGSVGWTSIDGARARDEAFAAAGVAGFEELVTACTALDVRFMVCEMGLRVLGLTGADLRDDIKILDGGIVSFLNDARADGAMLFV